MGVVMAEPKIVPGFQNRRLERRHPLASDAGAALYFRYPPPNGPNLEAPLRDVSLSGLSMRLPDELNGIQAGDIVKGIEARVARKTFRGDLLVMHVTPSSQVGPICGGLFYPEGDEDLITIRLVVRALEAESKE
jgi:hypothetical protein